MRLGDDSEGSNGNWSGYVLTVDHTPSVEALKAIKRRFNEGNEHMSNPAAVKLSTHTPEANK